MSRVRLISAIVLVSLISALSIGGCKEGEVVRRLSLTDGWMFRADNLVSKADINPDKWYLADVPGTVHTDLLKNGLIPDPFYGCNEKDLQWIGETNWRYRKSFSVADKTLASANINIVFEGLDTYARLFLNGKELGSTNNMFLKWEFNCKELLKPGENVVEILFESALNMFLSDSASYGYPVPGGRWVFARKAAYHFGWDWGPRFITAGITSPVYIESWDNIKPIDVQLYTKSIDSSKAQITATLEITSALTQNATITIGEKGSSKAYLRKDITLSPGERFYDIPFTIDNPKLWWSSGLGDAHIYELYFELKTASNESWREDIPYGIRTIEVVNREDSIGKPLYVKLNGVPVYMKGANYIPQHSFITEVADNHYREVINTAVKSNMNMIRVWGGGVYEKEIFYELCSRSGILVWQDFMFACAMYPPDDNFAQSVKREAQYQIKRLRNYPALAMWCGNNESNEGWHNWQWQKSHKIAPADSAKLWNGYLRIFHDILPGAVNELDPGRFYLPSSPMVGWGREASMTHSSSHYWGVWWGLEPVEKYLEKVPRFMSEFGLQAMPAISTIRDFQPVQADTLFSDELRSHQKHPTGYQNILAYLAMDSLHPKTLESFIHNSQIIQAKGIGMAIEAQRRSKPYCMGTLYWQLNDCWPVTSWSGTDVNNNWKALQYTVRNLYRDILVSVIVERDSCTIYLVSDRLTDTKGIATVDLRNFGGSRQNIIDREFTIGANSSVKLLSLPVSSFVHEQERASSVIEANFRTSDGTLFTNTKFLTKFGLLALERADIDMKIIKARDGYKITLNTTQFAPFVQLYLSESHARFSDNFFHLWPGRPMELFCTSDLDYKSFTKQLKIYNLNLYNNEN
ncbi:MAG: glycoside hydrolase family 2 protein [Bacteroidales bacterium]|nr:glycoside hydrolase family 2 protein [Bacteroidales bacterium]